MVEYMEKKTKRALCSHLKRKGDIGRKITEIIVDQMTTSEMSLRAKENLQANADVATYEIISMLKIK